jgi:hypothetical protein
MAYTNLIGGGWATNGVPLLPNIGSIPFTGRWIFVDAVNGSDGNEGTSDSPMQTIPTAYAAMTEGQNDVLVLVQRPTTAASTTGTFRLSATLTWAKSACHMIGMTAPTMIGQRARISTATGATTNLTPLISVTAQGCYFANFSIFQGVGQAATAECLMDVTGQRNYFGNISFQGMGSANGSGVAGSYCIYLNGAQENTFEMCTIGVDTQARTAANASVKLRSAATRNVFLNCLFPMYATASTPLFVDAAASGSVDRFNLFKGCTFQNAVNSGSGTAVAGVVGFNASQGGTTMLDNCSAFGATDWTATDTGVVLLTGPVPNGDTSGMAVASNAT